MDEPEDFSLQAVNGRRLEPASYFPRLYRRILTSHEFSEPLEDFAAKLGISDARVLIIELPASRPQWGGDLYYEVFDHESRSLLQISPDKSRGERATDILRREFPFEGRFSVEDADNLVHARAWKIRIRGGDEVGAFLFPHLDRPSTGDYVPSRIECFLLVDSQNRLLFSNPTFTFVDAPKNLYYGNLCLPNGQLWIRVYPTDVAKKSWVYRDSAGRPFATSKVLEDRLQATGGCGTQHVLTAPGSLLGPLFLQLFMGSRKTLKRTKPKTPV